MPAVMPGVIDPDLTYRLDALKTVAGLGECAVRTARKKGLRIRYCGGRGFVRGRDLVEYIETHGEVDHQSVTASRRER